MSKRYQFEGRDIFIGDHKQMDRVYPAYPGIYWFDMDKGPGRSGVETAVLVFDDFGNMVDGFGGAHQRAHFRKVLH